MRLLLDTHIALWALTDDVRLPAMARKLLLNPDNEVLFSVASIWEIAIKHGISRGNMPLSGDEAYALFQEAGYREISITGSHAAETEYLPRLYGDPFDRMLIAQAKAEHLQLLTHDKQLQEYGEGVLLV